MSFGNLLLAEWTKLRTVRRWMITLGFVAVLTIGLSGLVASGSGTDANDHRNFVTGPDGTPVADSLQFAHQTITGDATVTVHVDSVKGLVTMRDGGPDGGMTPVPDTKWTGTAGGVMMKDGTTSGSSYVAVLINATQGVHMQSDFARDIAGSTGDTSRWLRLTRTGTAVTGYESGDGTTWQKIGTMTPAHLPATAEAGFYTTSAEVMAWSRGMGGASLAGQPGQGEAVFDHPALDPAGTGTWQETRIKMPSELDLEKAMAEGRKSADAPADGSAGDKSGDRSGGGSGDRGHAPERRADGLTVTGDRYTLVGSGEIGPRRPADDIVEGSLVGVLAGLLTLIPVGVLFATAEFRKGMIRTTFTAEPRRGRVLAAKVLVLGAVSYVLSLVSVVTAFLVAQPLLRKHGFTPPAFVTPHLTDPAVVRVMLLSALFMTAVAVFALGVGMFLRHGAAAITVAVVLFVVPFIAGMLLPGDSPKFLMYTTLAGGLATLRADPPTNLLASPWSMIGPWTAICVALAYAAAGIGLAWWRTRTRDV
ncbi:ABC transporter permease subunit [Hamadaea tsunoensis]|uniref:ABC transporter permease subunit n=1 Tax=Hamadaea tsunoensis TaxID=53368 RepID=UPI0003FF59F4|nr:ABC transporter permease subunit [Hamadaea tsunoensis]